MAPFGREVPQTDLKIGGVSGRLTPDLDHADRYLPAGEPRLSARRRESWDSERFWSPRGVELELKEGCDNTQYELM